MNESTASLSWARTCYGLDLQGDLGFVVRAERKRGRVEYRSVALDEMSAGGRLCAGCVGARRSFARWVEAPFASLAKARRVLPTLLDLQLPFALEDCVYSFPCIKGEGDESTRALAVGARSLDVESVLEAFGAVGVDPVVLDHEGLAIWTQSLRELPVAEAGADVLRTVVFLGNDRATISVGRGEEFLASHGLETDDAARIRRLLVAQVETLHSRSGGGGEPLSQPRVQWVWTGPGAADGARVAALQEELGEEGRARPTVHEEPHFFLARALATRALVRGPLRCNLRSGALAHPAVTRRAGERARNGALLVLLSGLVLCAAAVGVQALAGRRESRLQEELTSLRDSLAGYHVTGKGEHGLKAVSEAVDERLTRMAPFVHALGPSLLATLTDVARAAGNRGLHVEVVALARDRVLIRGTAPEWRSCEELLAQVRRAGYAASLQRRDSPESERVPFTISSEGSDDE